MGTYSLQVIRKFLLSVLIIFSVHVSFGQTIVTLPGSVNDTVKVRGFIKVKGFQFPIRDTNYVPLELGDAVLRPQDSTIYVATSLIHIPHWTKVGTGSTSNWGTIGGTLPSQADLQAALNAKQNSITLGTSSQLIRGDLSLANINTTVLASLNSAVFTSAGPLSYSDGFILPKATSSIDGYLAGPDFTNFLSAYNKKVINVLVSGNTVKTITIFFQDGTQLQATWTDNVASGSSGVTSINTDTTHSQSLTPGTSGTDFGITTASGVTTFNLPTSSATNRGALSSADWISFNAKLANSDTVTKLATKWWAKNYTDTSSLIHYVNKDSLGNYLIAAISPVHVAFNNLLSTVPDSLYMDSADHSHDGYLVHADWDKLQSAWNKTSVNMSISGFILSLIKQDGSTIPVTLPFTPANGIAGNVQLSDGGSGFTSTNNFNIASGILNLNSNDLQIHNSLGGVTGTHWLKSDRALMTVVTSTVGSEIFANSSFIRMSYGSSDFGNLFGGATWNRMTFDNTGINISSQAPYGNKITLGAANINVSGNILMGTLASGQTTPTPLTIDQGGTYSNVNGDSLKLRLFHNTLATYGIGVSSNGSNAQMDFVIGDATGDFAFYTGSTHSMIMRLTNAGALQVKHLAGNGSTPTVVVGSSVTGTVSVVGNDLGGTVTLIVTSSTSLSTLAELFTLTFASTYSSTPNVIFSPANGAASANTTTCYVKGTSTAGFSIATANAIGSLPVTTYIWTYRVAN